ncbi:hypothetical protein PC9H_001562 [Pleurotus ostreatus]|uniref:Cerato-platanin n=1 Tax=Pleurotus ostreatus TaxID=5322 RepID=A0A8H7A408_PLEOS|nr:uncharacterized protein PC9H_001562 [Pleurotus ostreatus]KAF7441213.1 hypothetical protein PC9H_001562 [Pleurotus ostreatus]KAJ8699277.1 hypothetical protein PTI98_002408 [Pleurotus ostreatus]
MKLTSALSYVTLFVAPLATAVTVSFDETYDDAGGSLTSVACSDGNHGLITLLKVENFGQLPNFPFIGGAAAVSGWNSPQCGTCWELSYNGRKINILAIDHTDDGFNIALPAMNALTNGQAVQLGRVDAAVRQVDSSVCGL